MDHSAMDDILRKTLDDLRLSRSERRALGEVLEEATLSGDDRAWLRSRAFELAREELEGHENRLVLGWLEEVVKVVAASARAAAPRDSLAEAYFTPGVTGRILDRLRAARRSIEVCVFTITDDRLSRALIEAHRRGVAVRIITDDEKAVDRGSDIDQLREAGIPLRTDRSEFHMHHKFAIFDGEVLLTGSYNWTRGAASDNEENFLIVDDPRLVAAYAQTFRELWERFL